MKTKRLVLFFLLTFLLPYTSRSQQTLVHKSPYQDYKTALELFEKEKYGAAQKLFLEVAASPATGSGELKSNAEYYAAVCGLELFNKDAESLLLRFIRSNPHTPRRHIAYFRLGRFYYHQKRYRDAAKAFEHTDVYYLSNSDAAEYYFKLGYSYFSIGDFPKASKAFYEVKGTDSRYAAPAMFYYAHGEYQDKNYETALKGFLKLRNSEAFGQVIPYYITQIYYLQGKYDSLITYAPPLLEKASLQNATEISHLIGDALYRKSRYQEAIPYLETYFKNAPSVTRQEQYQMGYALYKSNSYERAAERFEKVTDVKDTLSQQALYSLADCFIRTGKRKNARNAFLLASEMDFDPKVKDESSYNFARLSAELGFEAEAITAFQRYLKKYPSSRRRDEINELLATLYLMTKNYKEALETLESISAKSEKIKRAYQRVAYYRGAELYSSGQLDEAGRYFDKSLVYTPEPAFTAKTTYWKAEISYRKGDYSSAARQYLEFIYMPGAVNSGLFHLSGYNIAYSYFKQEDYANALSWFRKYTKEEALSDRKKFDDALLRIADCFFVLRDYNSAIDYYAQAVTRNAASSDYALFQKGVIEGVQNNLEDKIETMQQLMEKYPKSPYTDDALYEAANSYLTLSENLLALNLFDELVSRFPSSSYVKKALLGTALLYYNERRDEKAMAVYKQIITTYPATPEAREALVGIKNIYVNAGDPQGYVEYANKLSFASVSETSQDSITYEAAEVRYMKDDCDNAVKDFENYIRKFANGNFIINANFYRAECELRAKNYEKALEGYAFVAERPKNTFTEKSVVKAARISYQLRQYDKALAHYTKLEEISEYKASILEARVGQMRSAAMLGRFAEAGQLADKVLSAEKLSDDIAAEARLNRGIALMQKDSLDAAMKEFELVKKGAGAEKEAEAKYNIAAIQHRQEKYKEAEKTLFVLVNDYSSDFWIAKGYILLADNYTRQGDLFQARATLQSVVDNYEGADLKELARKKLDELLAQEAARIEAEKKAKESTAPAEQPVELDTKNQ